MNLGRVTVTRKSGRERFRDGAADLGYDLLSGSGAALTSSAIPCGAFSRSTSCPVRSARMDKAFGRSGRRTT
jgi:hypothetical protein